MCKECEVKQYESFDELPQELKDKFKATKITKQTKEGYLLFINELNKRGDKLIGDYVKAFDKVVVQFSCGHTHDVLPSNYTRNHGCGFCSGKRVLKGFNDIATTQPHLVKYFVDVNDAYTHTQKSDKKVSVKCDKCGTVRKMSIKDLTVKNSVICKNCGDGVSYPEKVVTLLLKQLNINFTPQYKLDNFKYDFYLNDFNTIIEVHGVQHYWYLFEDLQYKRFNGKGKTGIEEHENDVMKKNRAEQEVSKYLVIDARESNIEWIKNSVEQCTFLQEYDLDSIDWLEIDNKAQSSWKWDVITTWNNTKQLNEKITPKNLADSMGLNYHTVQKYLKWGNEYGYCTYNPNDYVEKVTKYKIYFIKPNGEKWFDEPMSASSLAKITGIHKTVIGRAVADKRKFGTSRHAQNVKFEPKYIGSYVVLAEEWDKLHDNKEV